MKILFIEGDCTHEWGVDWNEFTAENCLLEFTKDEDDAEDWHIMDDETIAGLRFVQIGEDVEGETRKFVYNEELSQILEHVFAKENLEDYFETTMTDGKWLSTALSFAYNLEIGIDRSHFNDSFGDMMADIEESLGIGDYTVDFPD